MNQYWYTYTNESPFFTQYSSGLPTVLFLLQDLIQETTMYSLVLPSPALLDYVCFSYFPFFWWLWQFWGVMVRYFVGCLSVRICLMFFTWLDRGDYGSWGGRHRGNILFLYTISLTFLFLSQCSTNLLANPISFSTGIFPESNQLATLHNHHPGLCYHHHSLGWF